MTDETQIDLPGSAADPDSSAWLIGQHLNDSYVVDRLIKTGGMGEVYEGRNVQTGEPVAIKLILPRFAADEKFMDLFRHEARLLERIAHDALVKYRTLAFDRTVGRHYLVTEFVYGPSILDVLQGRPCQPATVRKVLKRLASGLAAAHAVGINHRDISPDNILLPEGLVENAKVIDFGIGQDMRPGRGALIGTAFAGKWGYAAPEVFGRFDRQIGPWSDVYSLALTVLALARGKPLDMGQSIIEALERRDDVPDLDWLDGNLKGIFRPMLMPDPAQRLRSMDQVLEALGSVVDPERLMPGVTTSGGDKPPAPSSEPRPRPTTERTMAIAAAAIIAVGGAIYAGTHGSRRAVEVVPPASPASVGQARAVSASAATIGKIKAAIAGVECGDLWIDEGVAASTVAVHGWRRAGTSLPGAIDGIALDTTRVTDAPVAAKACGEFTRLRRALGSHVARLPLAGQTISYGPGDRRVVFGPKLDIPAASRVYYRVWRLRGGFAPGPPDITTAIKLREMDNTDPVPAAYLIAVAAPLADAAVAAPHCAPGGCVFGSEVVEIKPR